MLRARVKIDSEWLIYQNAYLPTKKDRKEKTMSITEILTKIRMSALKEARNKFRYSSVWTADGKIMHKDEGDTKAKNFFD